MRAPCSRPTCRAIVVGLLAEQLRTLPAVERAQVVADALELARVAAVETHEAELVREQIG